MADRPRPEVGSDRWIEECIAAGRPPEEIDRPSGKSPLIIPR